MSFEPPTPPASVSPDLINTVNDLSPEVLRDLADYADGLAEHKEREDRLDDAEDNEDTERPEDLPNDVPSKATITIKTINDNRYYYWQWREGDKIKSKYKGPVNPDE